MFTVSKTVSDETLNCIITIESAGKVEAKAATSSALGLGQFLDATWLGEVKTHRPDVMAHNSRAAVLKMRTNAAFAIEILARFTEDNQRIVGMNCTGGDLYLAHFLGAGAAQHVFRAAPSAPVEPLVGPDAVRANESILRGKTCGQVRAWAAKRMAQSSGHAWVAKYYGKPPEPEVIAEEVAVEETPIEQIPDTQSMPTTVEDTPAATAIKDDPQVLIGKDVPNEGWMDWTTKLVKSKIQWASSALGGVSLAGISGAFSDTRVLIVVGVVAVCLTAIIIVERGRKP